MQICSVYLCNKDERQEMNGSTSFRDYKFGEICSHGRELCDLRAIKRLKLWNFISTKVCHTCIKVQLFHLQYPFAN